MPPSSSAFRPEIHGHRGCRGLRPENTLPAFLHALDLGVDALELDVVISADEQVVVSHEPWMSAAICRDREGAPIEAEAERRHNLFQLPYALIRQYDCGLTRHPRFPKQQSEPAYRPLLREVIDTTNAYAHRLSRPLPKFSIEIKSTPSGDGYFHPSPSRFVELVLGVIKAADITASSTILSFDKRVLRAVRTQAADLPVCLLVEDQRPLVEHLHELGFVPDVYGPEYGLLDEKLLSEIRAHGLKLVPWTVNEQADMQRLIALGVDGITTDYPDRLQLLLPR
jgi:glycerophosphoryl diester phosphodiesterase